VSVNIGIIGLQKSGRTTVFNALTGAAADTKNFSQENAPHVGVAKVPDPRLTVLTGMFNPRKVVPAETMYIDIGASIKSLAESKGISGEILTQLSKVDALLNVVRAFKDESVPHPEGSINIERDIAGMNLELTFSDLVIIEKRLTRIEGSLKSAKAAERIPIVREQELLLKLKGELENEKPIRELPLTPEENKAIANYQFLTAKPLLIVVNIGEEQLAQSDAMKAELASHLARPRCFITVMCGKLEAELAQLAPEEAKTMRAEYGIKESGLESVIKLSYELLGLISFLTVGADEVRAWPIQNGTVAQKAAGKVHSDIEKGFIRAEVISYDDLVAAGSLAEGRKKGLLRLEGKTYVVRDGDVINYLFNI
jgi:GTP-binding protein YchF